MRGGSRGSRILWLFWWGLGVSCAQITGIGDYRIDEKLDPKPAEGGAAGEAGGSSSDGTSAGKPGDGGEPAAGGTAGTGAAGHAGEPTQAGGSGGEPSGCTPAACDDTIDCTVDTCDENDECVNTPDTSLCDVDEDECVVCQAGIGCIAGALTKKQLLVDPAFDELSSRWRETIDDTTRQDSIINFDDAAHSGDYSAWFVGTDDTIDLQAYIDLLQRVTIPSNARTLRLSGSYELYGGVVAPDEDFVRAGLYDGTNELLLFHEWVGDDPESYPWTAFEYEAAPGDLQGVLGQSLTFDIYGYSWDSEFYFDTLSLEATVCEQATGQ